MADVERPKSKWPYYIGSAVIVAAVIIAVFGADIRQKCLTKGEASVQEPFFVYNFTKEKIVPGKVLTIKYYKDKTVAINLPIGTPAYVYTWGLESDVLIWHPLCGGNPRLDGPGKQFFPDCSGNAARLMQVTGVQKNGVMKITLDPIKRKKS